MAGCSPNFKRGIMAKLKNIQYESFAVHYAIYGNGAKAAAYAGYSEKSARIKASKMLTNANIVARIDELTDARNKELNLTGDMVVRELIKIGFRSMIDFIEADEDGEVDLKQFDDIPKESWAVADEYVIKEGFKKLKLTPKLPALLKLYDHTQRSAPKRKKPKYKKPE